MLHDRNQQDIKTGMNFIPVMKYYLKKMIATTLLAYGQQGCSVNDLFMNLRCSKNDFIDAKNQLIKEGVISTRKEGKQKIVLFLNSEYFSKLDRSFAIILQRQENQAIDTITQLKKLKPLFKHGKDKNNFSGIRVTNQNVAVSLGKITDILETISHYIMVFTLRYHIDPQAKEFDLTGNQEHGFKTIQNIIDRLIKQHKEEEKELRNYLLWGTTSSFSYVI
jgi:hypothetical protein